MRHTLGLYLRLIRIQIHSQLQYRVSFLFDLISTGFLLSSYFVSTALILQRFQNIGGWTLGEIALLWGLVEFSFGFMDMVFSGFDPDFFAIRILRGTLDQLLLRPISITAQVLGSAFLMRRLGRIFQAAVILAIGLNLIDIQWTSLKLVYLPVIIFSMFTFFGGLFIIGATLTFWTIQPIEAINIFTYGGTEMMAYPMHIYPDWLRNFFTYFIPAIFLNYYPALYLLDKPDPFHMPAFAPFLSPIVGLSMLIFALLFWQYGLKHYQGAGS